MMGSERPAGKMDKGSTGLSAVNENKGLYFSQD